MSSLYAIQWSVGIPPSSLGDYVECCIHLETAAGGETSKDEYGSGDDLNQVKFERVR